MTDKLGTMAEEWLKEQMEPADPRGDYMYVGVIERDDLINLLRTVTPEWSYDLVRARDFTQIIYLAADWNAKDPFYCGRAERHDPDEGVEGGWWDDSISDYVTPIAWMQYPLPSAQHVRTPVTAKMEKK